MGLGGRLRDLRKYLFQHVDTSPATNVCGYESQHSVVILLYYIRTDDGRRLLNLMIWSQCVVNQKLESQLDNIYACLQGCRRRRRLWPRTNMLWPLRRRVKST
jgi:hypothetical protein